MARWLFKEEPGTYSYSDLMRDGRTVWGGIKNALARQNLWKVQVGDQVFFYSTGKEKAIIGEMQVISGPRADPSLDDDKAVIVDVEPVRLLPNPVSLSQIKADEELADWDLVRLPRLSVLPVTDQQWTRVEQLAGLDI